VVAMAIFYETEKWQQSKWRKQTRFYTLTLWQTLDGVWTITKTWGSAVTRGFGQSKDLDCADYQAGQQTYQKRSIILVIISTNLSGKKGIIDMNDKITIRELSSQEQELLLRDQKFSLLRPTFCSKCGNKTEFFRRTFEIKGKNLATDEYARQIACYQVKSKHKCDHVFLKTRGKRYYIDTAICQRCQSTKIVYDIELNDELFEKASQFLNIPSSSIEREIKSFLNSTKRDSN
jgi:hypothetical protein